MATQNFYFTGKVSWPRFYPGQEDPDYGNFGCNFYPEDVAAFKATGVTLKERTDADGGVFFKLRRDPQKQIKGEMRHFGPPVILDKDNTPFNQAIGNGSKVTVKISVYDTRAGKGHRLESVRIEELIPYIPEDKPQAAPVGGEIPKTPF